MISLKLEALTVRSAAKLRVSNHGPRLQSDAMRAAHAQGRSALAFAS